MTTTTEKDKFIVQGVGIDTSTIISKPWIESNGEIFDYIHTSISANNDFLLKEYIGSQPGAPIITTIDFIDNPERAILGHLMEIDRKKINLLLVSGKALSGRKDQVKDIIAGLRNSGLIEEFGISNPEGVDQIQEIQDIIGERVKFISMELCPLHFNYEIVKYSKENEVCILGFNPFGGYLSSPRVIETFSIPYLLGFSGTYSTVVFLSGRDLLGSIDCRDYIRKYIIGNYSSAEFILRKSISKLVKPIKRIVNTSIDVVNGKIIIPYNYRETLYPLEDIVVSLGNDPKTYIEESVPTTDTEKSVQEILDVTEFPEDMSIDDKYAIVRYQVLSTIRGLYPEWELNVINLGDRILGIKISKQIREGKFFSRKKKTREESKNFLLAVTSMDSPVLFVESPDEKYTSKED